ncbi:MAG: riboflavin synthase [Deltaproteobacteria bacterium]|nr:riboflavin synthase [Deltaproteobacteria bacterium]
MFTGLIQALGTIRRREARAGGVRFEIESATPFEDVELGESIAVDGACLTVVSFSGARFEIDASPETLAKTTLGARREGHLVHLERAMRVGDRLGGHIVLGHVDGVGKLMARRVEGDYTFLTYEAPAEVLPYLVPKGSIAIDGVSLTVNALTDPRFEIAIIPHTSAHTHLTRKGVGEGVNLEADVLAKHVGRLLEAWRDTTSGGALTREFLEKHGY